MAVSKLHTYLSLLWLIVWKNLILRKRHWIVTSFEILLPTICAFLLWIMASPESEAEPKHGYAPHYPIDQNTTFERALSQLEGYGIDEEGEPTISQVLYSPLAAKDLLIEAFPQNVTNPRFELEGFSTVAEMTKYLAEVPESKKKPRVMVTAAFYFEGLGTKKLTYTIRTTSDSGETLPTKLNVFGKVSEADSLGMAGIQLQIDRVLFKNLTGTNPDYAVSLHPFPVLKEKGGGLSSGEEMATLFPMLLIFGFLFIIRSNVILIVSEKQTGIKEFMKMNGVSESIIWLGWMINSLIILVFSITLIVIILSGGKVLYHTDLSLFWVLLLLYVSWATSFCFLVSAFFDRPTLALNVGNILWLFTNIVLWFTFTGNDKVYSGTTTISFLCYCLLPHVPMQIALKILIRFEIQGVGAQWSNLLEPADFPLTFQVDSINMFLAMVMLVVDTALYWSLAIYIQNILPSKYGIRKPWYYLFQISEWGFGKKKVQRSDIIWMRDEISQMDQNDSFEKVSPDAKVAIEVLKLRKEFGRGRVAVENLSIKINEGEIFCLLGHNGAGKTTTFSILTGMMAPTSGTALVNDLDVRLDVAEIQKSIGFCPQHNLYFSSLTVSEHLEFFGRMKGLSKPEAKARIPDLLQKLQIADKAAKFGNALSGGQLRKLALGCALIGDAKILFLDECSSGLDPEARRFVWNLLLEQKGQRTIVLTTHFMEEADVLGDRVAIMKEGKISCCGSPLFLKQYYGKQSANYGTGYSLSITMDPSADPAAVLRLVQGQVDSAKQKGSFQMKGARPEPSHLELSPSETALRPELSRSETAVRPELSRSKKGARPELSRREFPDTKKSRAVSSHDQKSRDVSSHDQKSRDVSSHDQKSRDVSSHDQKSRDVSSHDQKSRDVSSHDQKSRDVSSHDQKSLLSHDTMSKDPMVLTITMPSQGETSSKLPAMFSELLANKQKLMIQDIGISMTTLDDVFIKIDSMNQSDTDANEGEQIAEGVSRITKPKTGGSLILSQFWGILMKKIAYSCKKRLMLVFMIGTCVFLSITGFLIQKNILEAGDADPIPISPSMYNTPKTVYSSVDPQFKEAYKQAIGSSFSFEDLKPGQLNDKWLLQKAKKDKRSYRRKYIIGAELDLKTPVARYSPTAIYSCPLAINTLTNAMLRLHSPTTKDSRINVILQPLPTTLKSSESLRIGVLHSVVMVAIFLPLGFTMFTATFVMLPIEENQSKVKQLQLMTGLSPGIYWLGSFLWDYILFFVSSIVVIIFCSLIDAQGLKNNGGLGILLLILLVYGVEAIGFSYLLSLRAKTVSGGYSFLMALHTLFGNLLFFLTTAIELAYPKLQPMLPVLFSVGRLFPGYSLAKSVFGFLLTSVTNYYCSKHKEQHICRSSTGGFLLRPLLTWKNDGPGLMGSGSAKSAKDSELIHSLKYPGTGQELFFMILISVFYFGILILCESCSINFLARKQNTKFVINSTDEDVQEERNRVDKMVAEGKTKEDAFVVHDLSKNFKSFSATSRLTFGVHRGECFGLLGVNGAGKTTAFRMLSGDETVSFGNAYIDELSLLQNKNKFLERIGYCPQFDAFIGILSGKSMLQLFARLRGVPVSEALVWLEKFGLTGSGKYRCDSYSGGMKRRLCTAMAMIGNPTLVMLDEPTSGVDPVSRRQFWKVVAGHRDAGNAVVLTSHSMEECEFLCGRLGIMVNGELQCFGGVQHLKSKFAQGKSLIIQLKVEANSQPDAVTVLTNVILTAYKPCSLRDYHANTMQFQIDSLELEWDKLFQIMEDMKSKFNRLIEDYSISQCTLEEIFLSFARKQYDNERKVDTSRKRCNQSCC